MVKKNTAIVSPNRNAYSETFIQAHRNIPGNEIHFLYGGVIPKTSELEGSLAKFPSLVEKLFNKLTQRKPENIYLKGLKHYLKRHHIEAVLAEYGITGAELLPICKQLKIPLFVHFHGFDASKTDVIKRYRDKYKQMFEYATRVFSVSKVMQQNLLELGCPSGKLILNTYGPKDLFLQIAPTFSEPKSFVAIGRFVNKKAPYYTILAINKVAEKHHDVKLYFGGEGELLETCRNLVKYLGLEENVKLLGMITPDDYASLLTKVSGFIQHSITAEDGDMEGTPVGVLEASAAGIPVISTNHAGIPDVIINDETGFLSEEHDVDGMAENIIRIIENPEQAKNMGQQGKQRIKEHFSMGKHLNILEKALEIK